MNLLLLLCRYKCNLCAAAFRLQAQLRDHYRIHYDATTALGQSAISNAIAEENEQKPQLLTDSEQINHHMIVDHQRREQQMQFVQQYSIIKNENKDAIYSVIDVGAPSNNKSYHDLSLVKKQKLDHQ